MVGAVVVGILAVVIVAVVVFRLPWHWLFDWLNRDEENARKTLYWSSGVFVGGGIIGGILGYVVGVRTAQLIYDMFAAVGTVVIVVAIIGVVFAIVIAFGRNSER